VSLPHKVQHKNNMDEKKEVHVHIKSSNKIKRKAHKIIFGQL